MSQVWTDPAWISAKCSAIDCCVRALPHAAVFEIYVRLVARLILQDFELSSPEWPLNADIVGDPSISSAANQFYVLLDRSRFHRSEVLNHRLEAAGRLRRGDVIEGWFLAQSFDPVPSRYATGSVMPVCLSIRNQFDEVFETQIELQVERIAARVQPQPLRRSTLYDRSDGSPGAAEVAVGGRRKVPTDAEQEQELERGLDRWRRERAAQGA